MTDAEELTYEGSSLAGGTVSSSDPLAMVGREICTSGCGSGAFWCAYRPYLRLRLDAFLAFADACFIYLTDAFRHVDPFG